MSIFKRVLCALFGHSWKWYLTNNKSTIVGMQYCVRCMQMRGVIINQRDEE